MDKGSARSRDWSADMGPTAIRVGKHFSSLGLRRNAPETVVPDSALARDLKYTGSASNRHQIDFAGKATLTTTQRGLRVEVCQLR